jgi:hypothetical protein
LTKPLADYDKTVWQGINGPVWALIALDSNGYSNPRRDDYIAEILRRQLPDGGWDLANRTADPDMTGMALQALAPYRDRANVKAAIDKALKINFTFASSEGVSQVLVAYAALGLNTDALTGELMKYASGDGGYNHVLGSDGGDRQMSAEQALYALTAAQRARDGKTALYDMTDIASNSSAQPTKTSAPNAPTKTSASDGLPGKNKDVKSAAITKPGVTFDDVTNHPNKTAIEALASREIISGKGGGKFDPDGLVTRAEFAAMASLALGLPEKPAAPFTDVPSGQWYAKSVATAYYYEIIAGVGDNKFNPSGGITRQEAAAMTARAAKLAGMDVSRSATEIRDALAQFGDYKTASDYALEALAFCYSEGVLDDSALDIKPKENAKRAEIAETLYRLLNKSNLL